MMRINDFIKAAKDTDRVVLYWRVNLAGAMLIIILISNFSDAYRKKPVAFYLV